MDDPPIAEAVLIEGGTVTAIGAREDVLGLAHDGVLVLDIGSNVAYPGFIDAHAHWIGDREYYGADSAEAAMNAAVARGWTSISEQWVDSESLAELEVLAAHGLLPIRVDAYLALDGPAPGGEHLADWLAHREPGEVAQRLRVRGLKIRFGKGGGGIFNWESAELIDAIGRADDAGWQVSVHTVSTEAHDIVLDAFESALGADGRNPRHHRIEHAIQVTDRQLARIVAMDLGTVVHLDRAVVDIEMESDSLDPSRPDSHQEAVGWLERWRDFVDAGIHVAAGSDAPWILPDLQLTDAVGRPVDQVAGGLDGRGRANPDSPDSVRSQLLTVEQGLRAVTVDAAWALGDEARRGHLALGTQGDVTILSGDVLASPPDEIRAMTVIATIVGGNVAYCSDAAVCGAN